MTTVRSDLRARAESLGHALPPLLVEAERLAATVIMGEHGRRQAGRGDEFWQYRAAGPGDPARLIDWRRSARSDSHYVREREWQAAQSILLWVDPSRGMTFASDRSCPAKGDRARLLALALAVLLLRGGENVGLLGITRPRGGRVQLDHMLTALMADSEEEDFAEPRADSTGGDWIVLMSDFLGPLEGVERTVAFGAGHGARGAILQILDPAEEDFAFHGRMILESMTGRLWHETRQAGALRQRYLDRLSERKARLAELAARAGWQFSTHHTGAPARQALLWLYHASERER